MEYYNQVFDQRELVIDQWTGQEFEECTFRRLDLSATDLANASIVNCRFEGCNLTRVVLKNTKLYDATFVNCQLAYVDFGLCDPFGFHANFQECQLDHAVFLSRKLKKAQFVDCSIKEAFFLKCDLTGTVFKNCNLELTRFEDNNLTQADFTSSYNLEISPEENKLKKARFSIHSLPGLLTKYDLIITK